MFRSFMVLCALLAAAVLMAQQSAKMTTVDPDTASAGAMVTVNGENLDKNGVKKLYLTDGTNDTEVEIVEQGAASIKFKIPAGVKPGRLSLMILTAGENPRLVEQPVKVTIE
ncbi:MAG: hypothetical protein IPM24_22930 [Bryobacterales bacterium]|nr:hypothetical protein [Bryobacterales bacterium]